MRARSASGRAPQRPASSRPACKRSRASPRRFACRRADPSSTSARACSSRSCEPSSTRTASSSSSTLLSDSIGPETNAFRRSPGEMAGSVAEPGRRVSTELNRDLGISTPREAWFPSALPPSLGGHGVVGDVCRIRPPSRLEGAEGVHAGDCAYHRALAASSSEGANGRGDVGREAPEDPRPHLTFQRMT